MPWVPGRAPSVHVRMQRLCERHARVANARARENLRLRARTLCEQAGIAVPPWAARRGANGRAAPEMSAQPPPAPVSVSLPAALREWRSRNNASFVRVSRGGVELGVYGFEVRRFASIADAIRYVEAVT
jgi:hypothetical protein